MTNSVAATLLALALLLSPTLASAQMGARDRQVMEQISQQVTRYTQYTIFDSVSASVEDGRVILTGWVTMPYKKQDLEQRVGRVGGVIAIENAISVLPVSHGDDQLRFRIARAIYGNSSFWQYASMVNPPIHILVNRGRVTLEGVVNSNVDRMLARSLATGFGAFEVTNLLRTDAEVREALSSGPAAAGPPAALHEPNTLVR
jgi:hyperosmotically inducible periplasmic protein